MNRNGWKPWGVCALTLILTLSAVYAGGKRYHLYLCKFHLEGDIGDNPKFMIPVSLGSERRTYHFNKIPSFTDADIAWFYPFNAENGLSYGAAFRLKDHAATELTALSRTNPGKLLGLTVGDAPVAAVRIDRPVDDGVIVMWEGLQPSHLQEFQKRFPHVDTIRNQQTGPTFAPGER